MDLNGLKRCNDCFGYAAGDALICRAADALNDVFPGEACRIGGDEFVVICCPVTQEKFEQQVEALRAALVRHQVDAAIGSFWQSLVEDTFIACLSDSCHNLRAFYRFQLFQIGQQLIVAFF